MVLLVQLVHKVSKVSREIEVLLGHKVIKEKRSVKLFVKILHIGSILLTKSMFFHHSF